MFGLIPFKQSGIYEKRDVVKTYKHKKVADKAANRAYESRPELGLVVREVKYLKGTYDELPGFWQQKLAGKWVNEITGTEFVIEGTHRPEFVRLVYTDSNRLNAASDINQADAERLCGHSKRVTA